VARRRKPSPERGRGKALPSLFRAGGFGAVCAAATSLVAAPPATGEVRLHGEAGGSYTLRVTSWRDIPFRTIVRQQYDYSCGSAAVATLLTHHYGVPTREADVFTAMWAVGDQAKIRKVGFSLLDMKRYLEGRGFRADGYRLSLDQLAAARTPAIVLITMGSYRHFVVVKGFRGDQVLLGDPARGLMVVPRAQFEKMWSGIVFAIPGKPDAAAFNRKAEWDPWARAPTRVMAASTARPVDSLTRELPPLYQIAPAVFLNPPRED